MRHEVADIIRIKQTGHKFRVMKGNIYVASSWRNEYYPEVVTKLIEALK